MVSPKVFQWFQPAIPGIPGCADAQWQDPRCPLEGLQQSLAATKEANRTKIGRNIYRTSLLIVYMYMALSQNLVALL